MTADLSLSIACWSFESLNVTFSTKECISWKTLLQTPNTLAGQLFKASLERVLDREKPDNIHSLLMLTAQYVCEVEGMTYFVLNDGQMHGISSVQYNKFTTELKVTGFVVKAPTVGDEPYILTFENGIELALTEILDAAKSSNQQTVRVKTAVIDYCNQRTDLDAAALFEERVTSEILYAVQTDHTIDMMFYVCKGKLYCMKSTQYNDFSNKVFHPPLNTILRLDKFRLDHKSDIAFNVYLANGTGGEQKKKYIFAELDKWIGGFADKWKAEILHNETLKTLCSKYNIDLEQSIAKRKIVELKRKRDDEEEPEEIPEEKANDISDNPGMYEERFEIAIPLEKYTTKVFVLPGVILKYGKSRKRVMLWTLNESEGDEVEGTWEGIKDVYTMEILDKINGRFPILYDAHDEKIDHSRVEEASESQPMKKKKKKK
jgi:hypothetical protein